MIAFERPKDLLIAKGAAEVLNCEKCPALAGVGKSSHTTHAVEPPRWAVAAMVAATASVAAAATMCKHPAQHRAP